MSLRNRLALLVLLVVALAVLAGGWAVSSTFVRERTAIEQTLRETSRALALVVDRELGRREAVAWTLAASPSLGAGDLADFEVQAREASASVGGWIVLFGDDGMVVNTARPTGAPLPERGPQSPRIEFDAGTAVISDLFVGPAVGRWVVAISVPVKRPHRAARGLSVVMLPEHLQRVIDEQQLPAGWFASILDRQGVIVARQPDPAQWVGHRATAELVERMGRQPEGLVRVRAVDGVDVTAYYSRSPSYGWTFVIGEPDAMLSASLARSLLDVGIAWLGIVLVALAGALVLGRRIAVPAARLQAAAQALKAGAPVRYEPAGLPELDVAGATLEQASAGLREAQQVLEQRVAAAVRQTRETQERLAASQRLEALGRLTGGVAHDVNNVLAVVANSAELLKRLPPGAAQDKPLASLMRAVDTGRRLTQKLLAFSRQRKPNPVVLDLAEWLPAVQPLLKASVSHGVATSIEVAPDTPPVEVDPAELELSLLNLAINASDAMPQGGTLAIRAARHAPAGAPAAARITVRDSGSGIPAELLPRVFEPFFTTKDSSKGSGLGLSQVHGFCEQAGGSVSVASTLGEGTTVTLTLPATARPLPAAPPAAAPPAPGHRRLLYVEDNAELADATRALLGAYGYSVDWASNADDALRRLHRERFDVLLSDVVMPGRLNGLGLAEKVRELYPKLPVVLVTGFTAERRRASSLGFEVLDKPCLPDALAAALARATPAAGVGAT